MNFGDDFYAKKALDALSVPPDQRWTSATWVNDDGEWVARGPKRTNRNPTPIPGESAEEYEARCFADDENEPGCDGDQQAQADAERMCLAVNLASPLAAVARAAVAYRHKYLHTAERCAGRDALFAALDALEAAAKEVTP